MLVDLITPQNFFLLLGLYALGAVGALLWQKNDRLANWWGNGLAALASLVGLIYSSTLLLTGQTLTFARNSSFPNLTFSFRLDYLAAYFLLIIFLIAFIASLYGLSYVKHYYQKYNLGTLGFFYNSFIIGMIIVVSAQHALFFLLGWEIMSLASYFLVIFEHRDEKNIKAGSLYFIMMHIGTAFIIMAFLLLAKATGTFDFAAMKENFGQVTPLVKSLIFVFALIGFGTKAGIIPLHIWLPSAHPAAPSHVSALMSGVMIKTGILMIIRFVFEILPNPPLWWGWLILALGALSALLGVLYALTEHDLKKLLAYHSIENIGIILLGLGAATIFISTNQPGLALIALIAALFHTLNHAIFKALLFLGAGAVINETHTKNIEKYGGLIKYMPYTALFFLIGSLAISALPPFNGFFSEWLVYQSLFAGVTAFSAFTKMLFILAIGSLAFTGGLAVACFVKAFGITFLARPRSAAVHQAHEAAWPARFGMAILAILTLILGIGGGRITGLLAKIGVSLTAFAGFDFMPVGDFKAATVGNGFASLSLPTIALSLMLALVFSAGLIVLVAGRRKNKTSPTWNCGTALTPRMEITATGFARSIILVFKGILRPTKQTEIEYHDANLRYFPKSGLVTLEVKDIYRSYFYQIIQTGIAKISEQFKKIQNGNINLYILYIFIALLGLLLIAVI